MASLLTTAAKFVFPLLFQAESHQFLLVNAAGKEIKYNY
jgi:hypothetical protein